MFKPRVLVGIPMLYGAEHCGQTYTAVTQEADVLIIENGSDDEVKLLIREIEYYHNSVPTTHKVTVIHNPHNMYVNPAWNQIMDYFLQRLEYDHLVILNSDFILKPYWSGSLCNDFSCLPTDGSHREMTAVWEGTPGVFIHLTREMVKMVYPIPGTLKVWFGDNWIFDKLRTSGIKTVIIPEIIGHHYQNGSQTISRVPNIAEIIEQDKLEWAKICG